MGEEARVSRRNRWRSWIRWTGRIFLRGVLDLRALGIPCGFRPLAGPAALFTGPAIAAPLFLPTVPVFGLLLWAIWIAIRHPWKGGPKVALPDAAKRDEEQS